MPVIKKLISSTVFTPRMPTGELLNNLAATTKSEAWHNVRAAMAGILLHTPKSFKKRGWRMVGNAAR